MPSVSGMVSTTQDLETRLSDVIASAHWISGNDMFLVVQGKQMVIDKVALEEWVTPYIFHITWINNNQGQNVEVSLEVTIDSASV